MKFRYYVTLKDLRQKRKIVDLDGLVPRKLFQLDDNDKFEFKFIAQTIVKMLLIEKS
jgi:hypothetical protein